MPFGADRGRSFGTSKNGQHHVENLIEILGLIDRHFDGLAPDFPPIEVECRYYRIAPDISIPFQPPICYGIGGQLCLPYFNFWRKSPLRGKRLSVFMTIIDAIREQEPDIEKAKVPILDFSIPPGEEERTLVVIDEADIERVGPAELKSRLQVFADGYRAARDELAGKKPEKAPGSGDAPISPGRGAARAGAGGTEPARAADRSQTSSRRPGPAHRRDRLPDAAPGRRGAVHRPRRGRSADPYAADRGRRLSPDRRRARRRHHAGGARRRRGGEHLKRTTAAMARHRNATPEYVRRHITEVRQHGFCASKAVLIEGTTGISAAVPAEDGRPDLAVSLSAASSRVPEARVKPLAADLTRTCARIGQLLARRGGDRGR